MKLVKTDNSKCSNRRSGKNKYDGNRNNSQQHKHI